MATPEADQDEARSWLREHWQEVKGATLPADHRRDPDTGETLDDASSPWLNPFGNNRDYLREHSTVFPYGDMEDLDGQVNDEEVKGYYPLLARRAASLGEVDIRLRMERAFAQLTEEQQQLLRYRYFECMTLREIADETGKALSNVHGRMETAVKDLYVAIVMTWNLPVLLERKEGAAPRNEEAEKRAAEWTIANYFEKRVWHD